MSASALRAANIRHRYHMDGPANLDLICACERLIVVSYPFIAGIDEVIYENHIGLADRVTDRASRRVLIAHALGHFFMHRGNHADPIMDAVTRSQHEHQADAFAYSLLMPATELPPQRCKLPQSDLADYYDVPIWYVAKRLHSLAEEALGLQRARNARGL